MFDFYVYYYYSVCAWKTNKIFKPACACLFILKYRESKASEMVMGYFIEPLPLNISLKSLKKSSMYTGSNIA